MQAAPPPSPFAQGGPYSLSAGTGFSIAPGEDFAAEAAAGAAAAAAAAAAEGQEVQTVHVEVPRQKVSWVVGAQAATLKAIKSISGAVTTVHRNDPQSLKAIIQIVGTVSEVERAKDIISAMVGAPRDSSLGVSRPQLPCTVVSSISAAVPAGLTGVGALRPPITPRPFDPFPMPGGIGGACATGSSSMQPTPEFFSQLITAAASHLVAQGGDGEEGEGDAGSFSSRGQPEAFDRDALRRLAMMAKAQEKEAAPPAAMVAIPPELPLPKMQPVPQARPEPTPVLQDTGLQAPPMLSFGAPAPFTSPAPTPNFGAASTPNFGTASPPNFGAPPPGPMPGPAPMTSPAPAVAPFSVGALPSEPADQAPPKEAYSPEDSPGPPAPASSKLAAAGFSPAPIAAFNDESKKDASSVLKFLQGAKDNIARAARSARGGQSGSGQQAQQDAPQAPQSPTDDGGGAVSSSSRAQPPAASSRSQAPAPHLTAWESLCNRLTSTGDMSADSRRAVEKEVLNMLPQLEPVRAVDLVVRAHFAEGLRASHSLLSDLCRALAGVASRFRSPDLTRLTEAMASWSITVANAAAGAGDEPGKPLARPAQLKLTEAERSFFNAVSAEVSLRLMDIAPSDLARIAGAIASLGVGSTKLFSSIARAAVARADRFAPGELVGLIKAFDEARCFHTTLYEALARSLRVNARHAGPKEIVHGLSSLAMCNVRSDRADALARAIGDSLAGGVIGKTLSAEESCLVAWAFCALDLFHAELFRAVFRALEDAPVQASRTLCQLYEMHLSLKAFHHGHYAEYELEDDTVRSLRDHYRKHPALLKKERSSERMQADIADVLREVLDASISTNYCTSLGFSVDIVATTRSSRRSSSSDLLVAIDVDGPHTLIRSLDALENATTSPRIHGQVSLKRRILQKNGVRLVTFAEEKYRSLDGSREKRDFLRNLLRAAGINQDKLL